MENSQKIKLDLNQIINQANGFIDHFEFGKAYHLALNLDKQISEVETDPQIKAQYQQIINRLQALTMNLWPDQIIINLFDGGIADGLKDDEIPLIERLRYKLADLPVFDRDLYRQKLIRHLQDNTQVLTEAKVVADSKTIPGSITNWLNDYIKKVGGGNVDNIQRASYLAAAAKNFNLSSRDKELVKKLIDLFEYLKLSSLTPEGFEDTLVIEDQGDTIVFDQGQFFKVGENKSAEIQEPEVEFLQPQASISEEKPSVPAGVNIEHDEVLAAYQGDVKMIKNINSQELKLGKKFGDSVAGVRDGFYKSVQKKDVASAVALLRLMAKKDQLENFLVEDQKLNDFLYQVWQKQYGQVAADEFKSNPKQLKFVRLFLRYILEQRLGLDSSDAARIGLQIANIFVNLGKTGYNEMAYFDANIKKFKWFEN
ncbi:MAG: hypothetical protein JW816_02855 [Candidatus Buchananbacteria bacterium]|nr:hypothetical protein [Candidatus Buchananbacteria bacterium]